MTGEGAGWRGQQEPACLSSGPMLSLLSYQPPPCLPLSLQSMAPCEQHSSRPLTAMPTCHAAQPPPLLSPAVHQYDIVLDVSVINRTGETMQNVSLELATMGDLKLVERPQAYTLAPGAQQVRQPGQPGAASPGSPECERPACWGGRVWGMHLGGVQFKLPGLHCSARACLPSGSTLRLPAHLPRPPGATCSPSAPTSRSPPPRRAPSLATWCTSPPDMPTAGGHRPLAAPPACCCSLQRCCPLEGSHAVLVTCRLPRSPQQQLPLIAQASPQGP